MLMTVLKHLMAASETNRKKNFWIAYSGGLDSHVLLSLCCKLRRDYPLTFRAIHINHQLSPHAKSWSQHCKKICAQYEIDFFEKDITWLQIKGQSLEEKAREMRYAAFGEYMQEGDVLLTAHHQEDQAETLLLQLLRGAGPKGLAAMPYHKSFGKGFHVRPLLSFSRKTLLQYAHKEQMIWIEDESNQNVKHSRNFIRHAVMPMLESRWPMVAKTMARTAMHCAEFENLLDTFALDLLKNLFGSNEQVLSVEKIRQLDMPKQRLLLRTWIKLRGFPLPDTKKIDQICTEVLMAGPDRLPCVKWGNTEARRYRDDLYIISKVMKPVHLSDVTWEITQPLILPGIGILSAKEEVGCGLKSDIQTVSVCFRQGGEKITLPRRGRRTLKNLFQEWRIPVWERNRVPLLYVGGECIGAVGFFLNEGYTAKPGEIGYQPSLLRG